MNKKLLVLVVVFTVFALVGSSALALAPMGPPTAGLKTGQVRAGAEYSYSNADFKVEWEGDDDEYTAKDIKVNMFTANIGYGIMDEWEAFARLGFGNAKGAYYGDDEDDGSEISGDYKFAWGLGTKFTFLKQENIDWGVLFQIGWLKTEGSESGSEVDGFDTYTWEDNFKLSVYDMEIAVGPTWKAAEGLSIYGGPFFNLVNGSIDDDWTETDTYDNGDDPPEIETDSGSESADVKQKSIFGGYVGAQFDLSENASVFGEFQFTGGAMTFATGVGWKF